MTKIYGLIEKTDMSFGFIPIKVSESHPDLDAITHDIKNSKVGLELGKGAKARTKKEDLTIVTPKIYLDLYKKLKINNEICFLDESIEEHIKFIKTSPQKFEQLKEIEKFKMSVRENYFSRIKRTQTMKKNIEQDAPEFVFIGAAHALDLYRENKNYDVWIEYATNIDRVRENIATVIDGSSTDSELDRWLKHLQTLNYSLCPIKNLPEQIKEKLEEEIIENKNIQRYYNLLEKGTIAIEKRKPDFIGSWSLRDIPLKGFFEMYIQKREGNQIEGVIFDGIGDAEFHGEIEKDRICFTKIYTKARGIGYNHPIPGDILYSAMKNNDIPEVFYRGEYRAESGSDHGHFLLMEYFTGLEQLMINAESEENFVSKLRATT